MSIPEIPGPFPAFIQNPADFFLLLYESAFSSHTYYMQSGNTLPFAMYSLRKNFIFLKPIPVWVDYFLCYSMYSK